MTDTPTTPRRPRRTVSIRTLMRSATSNAASRYGCGGRLKERHRPRAISLAPVMAMARPADEETNS